MTNNVITRVAVIVLLVSLSAAAGGQQRQITSSGGARGVSNAIVGRVTDSAGQPSAGTMVTLLRESTSRLDDSRRLGMVSALLASVTDEGGMYRLENLAPGSYYPVAFPQNLPAGRGVRLVRSGHAVTYFPGVTSGGASRAVVVGATDTVTANLQMVAAPLFTIAGAVSPPDSSQPWRNERLSLAHAEDSLFGLDSKALSLAPNGTFVVPNMPSGSYCLEMHVGAWPPARGVIPTVYATRVTVIDRDITNVRLAPIRMVKVTGRVTLDPAARASFQASTVSIAGILGGGNCNPGPTQPGVVRDDLSFEFLAWPGLGYVLASPRAIGDLHPTVRLNGVDVTKTGIEFREGTDIAGVVVEIPSPPRTTTAPTPRGRF